MNFTESENKKPSTTDVHGLRLPKRLNYSCILHYELRNGRRSQLQRKIMTLAMPTKSHQRPMLMVVQTIELCHRIYFRLSPIRRSRLQRKIMTLDRNVPMTFTSSFHFKKAHKNREGTCTRSSNVRVYYNSTPTRTW